MSRKSIRAAGAAQPLPTQPPPAAAAPSPCATSERTMPLGVPPPGLYRLAVNVTNPEGQRVHPKRRTPKPSNGAWGYRDIPAGMLVKIEHIPREDRHTGPIVEVVADTPDMDCTHTNRCTRLDLGLYTDASLRKGAGAKWYPSSTPLATMVRGGLREVSTPDLSLVETLSIFGVSDGDALRALLARLHKDPHLKAKHGAGADMLLLCEALVEHQRQPDDTDTSGEVE